MKFESKPPLYVLPHGVEVIGEYPPRGKNRYWRIRVRPHPFFAGRIVSGGVDVRRSRAVMSAHLGRALLPTEHVHHKNENRDDDSPENLELLTATEHNQHHKVGATHSKEAREKISLGLKRAIAEGRRNPPPPPNWSGRALSEEAKKKISATRKARIASGVIEKSIPPVHRGESNSRASLSNSDVLEIRRLALSGKSKKSIASNYRVAIQTIYNILNRTTWSHI